MRRSLVVLVCAGLVSVACSAQAQNLLVNGDLEASPAYTYYDGWDLSVSDDVHGWLLFLGATSPDGSYVLVSSDVSGTIDVDTGASSAGAGLETAPGSRPAVTPGLQYVASLTYDNYFGPTLAEYYIDWFDGGGSLISSSGGLLADPNGAFTFLPYTQELEVSDFAPAGAASAGVRFVSGNPGYNGLTADNFSLAQVPEPATMALMALAGLGLLGVRNSRR